MDKCRIAWARVKEIKSDLLGKILVEYRPLVAVGNRVDLGEVISKDVWVEMNDKAFVGGLNVGDMVSIHWDWVCDLLTTEQVKNLDKWTRYNLNLANV